MAAQATDVEAQLLKATAELAEYKEESASLQNQTHTIRALQDKIKTLESSLQEQVLYGCGGGDWAPVLYDGLCAIGHTLRHKSQQATHHKS